MSQFSQAESLVERFMVQATKRAEDCGADSVADFLVGYLKGQLTTVVGVSDEAMQELKKMVVHLEKN